MAYSPARPLPRTPDLQARMFRQLGWERQDAGWVHVETAVSRVDPRLWGDLSAALESLSQALREGESFGPFARLARPQGRINRHLADALTHSIQCLGQMEASLSAPSRRRLGDSAMLLQWLEDLQRLRQRNAVGRGQHWLWRRLRRDQQAINHELARFVVRVRERSQRMAEQRVGRTDTENFQGFKLQPLPPLVVELAGTRPQAVRWMRPQQRYNRALRTATTEIHDLLRWIDYLS